MQGWVEVPKSVRPVGEFDVIYLEDRRELDENCAYADGPDRSIQVCEKNGKKSRSRRGSRSTTNQDPSRNTSQSTSRRTRELEFNDTRTL